MARVSRGFYSPTKGPLAGQVFFSQTYAGKTHSAQSVYQDTLSRHYGYRNYYERRKAVSAPDYRTWKVAFKNQLSRNGEKYDRIREDNYERLFARLWQSRDEKTDTYNQKIWNESDGKNWQSKARSYERGLFADFLEYIGIRRTQAYWYVGETPRYSAQKQAANRGVQPPRGEIEF